MGSELDILEDAAEGLPHTTRAMFGGHGLFAPNGAIFAATVGPGQLAVKLTEPEAAAAFAKAGGKMWVYETMTKPMAHWYLFPERMLDEPRSLREWLARAHAAARLAPPKKAKKATAGRAPKKTPATARKKPRPKKTRAPPRR